MTTAFPDCGTYAAYQRHRDHQQEPCPPCRTAARDYARARLGMKPYEPPECGTTAGYDKHKREGEEPCADCREARRAYNRRRQRDQRYRLVYRPMAQELVRRLNIRTDAPCGTPPGFVNHLTRRELPCQRCISAARKYLEAQGRNP